MMLDLWRNAKASEHLEGATPADSGQAAILQAITSLKTELMAKMDENVESQKIEMRLQISSLREEIKAAIDQANTKANALEERTASLEVAANNHLDSTAKLE